MSILTGFLKTKKYRKTASGYKLQSEWTSAETVEMKNGQSLEYHSRWKKIPSESDFFTGSKKADILSLDAEELLIKANLNNQDIILNVYIPGIALYSESEKQQEFRAGYFQNGSAESTKDNGGAVMVRANKESVTLRGAYLNGKDVTEETTWTIFYR